MASINEHQDLVTFHVRFKPCQNLWQNTKTRQKLFLLQPCNLCTNGHCDCDMEDGLADEHSLLCSRQTRDWDRLISDPRSWDNKPWRCKSMNTNFQNLETHDHGHRRAVWKRIQFAVGMFLFFFSSPKHNQTGHRQSNLIDLDAKVYDNKNKNNTGESTLIGNEPKAMNSNSYLVYFLINWP